MGTVHIYVHGGWAANYDKVGMEVDVHGSSIPARRRVNSVPTDRVRALLAALHVRVALARCRTCSPPPRSSMPRDRSAQDEQSESDNVLCRYLCSRLLGRPFTRPSRLACIVASAGTGLRIERLWQREDGEFPMRMDGLLA